MYKNILLASDGSEHALRALKQAINLAREVEEATVTIVSVVDRSKTKKAGSKDEKIQKNDHHTNVLDETKEELSQQSIPYKVELLYGNASEKIVEFINGNQIDIGIIGSRGLNSLQEMVLGSVSHKVAKYAKCPILIVK